MHSANTLQISYVTSLQNTAILEANNSTASNDVLQKQNNQTHSGQHVHAQIWVERKSVYEFQLDATNIALTTVRTEEANYNITILLTGKSA